MATVGWLQCRTAATAFRVTGRVAMDMECLLLTASWGVRCCLRVRCCLHACCCLPQRSRRVAAAAAVVVVVAVAVVAVAVVVAVVAMKIVSEVVVVVAVAAAGSYNSKL